MISKCKGETPLYITITKGYADIVCLLIDNGANANIDYGTNKFLVNKCTSKYFTSCDNYIII